MTRLTMNCSGRAPAGFALRTAVVASAIALGVNASGVVLIETAFCLPLATAAFIGGFAVAQGCLNQQRLQNAAAADANSLAAGQPATFVASLGGGESISTSGTAGQQGFTVTISATLGSCASLFGHTWPCSVSAVGVRP